MKKSLLAAVGVLVLVLGAAVWRLLDAPSASPVPPPLVAAVELSRPPEPPRAMEPTPEQAAAPAQARAEHPTPATGPVAARASTPPAAPATAPAAERVDAHAPAPAAADAAPSIAAAFATAAPAAVDASALPAAADAPLPGAITGTLRDAAGAPIADAAILSLAASGEDAVETRSDDDGFYLLPAVRPGRHLLFTGLGTRLASRVPARAVEVRVGAVVRVELREPAAGTTVTIVPLEADGRPAHAQVMLVAGAVPAKLSLAALLGADAIVLPDPAAPTVLRHVPAGVYSVVVLPPGNAPPRAARAALTVSGEGVQRLELRLPADLVADDGAPGLLAAREPRPAP